jgi:ABC-2 type transport system permease protein
MMNGWMIFKQTLRDSRRAALAIGIGGALLAMMVTAFYPLFKDFKEINQLLENPVISALVGNVGDYTTPQGFLGSEFFGFMPLFLAFFTVVVGLWIVASDEETGRLDVLLSTPTPRWQVIVQRVLAYGVMYVVILALMLAGFAIIVPLMPDLGLPFYRIAEGMLNLLPMMLLPTALTLLLSTLLRGRNTAAGVAGAIVVASWFANALADLAPQALQAMQRLSVFYYYDSFGTLNDGLNLGSFILLMALATILAGLSLVFFQRRDLMA